MIKKIGILTSGGDSPGMNSVIYAINKSCLNNNIELFVIYEGFRGLAENKIEKLDQKKIKTINKIGGTIIYSSRFDEFKTEESVRKNAVNNLKKNGIEAVIGIGGDGTFNGLLRLSKLGIKTIGIPATIDNDIATTDLTIGFLTALDTIVKSIDSIWDTSESHNRVSIIEVMGRHCGDLALFAANSCNVDVLSLPEKKLSENEILTQVKQQKNNGKRAVIVLVTEKLYNIEQLSKKIENSLNYECRATVLGHIQRGGYPTSLERFFARQMGAFAVKSLLENKNGITVNFKNSQLITINIEEVIEQKRKFKSNIYELFNFSK